MEIGWIKLPYLWVIEYSIYSTTYDELWYGDLTPNGYGPTSNDAIDADATNVANPPYATNVDGTTTPCNDDGSWNDAYATCYAHASSTTNTAITCSRNFTPNSKLSVTNTIMITFELKTY